MSEDLPFVWPREDGQPWESVDSLPPPLDAVRTSSPPPWEQTTYEGPYYEGTPGEDLRENDEPLGDTQQAQPWESLESLPPPLDDLKSYEHPRVKNEEEEEEWKDAEEIPRDATTPRASTPPDIGEDVLPLYDMGYVDPSRRRRGIPILSSRSPYPPYPTPRPGPLSIPPPRRPLHGHNGHPPIIPLSTLVEQLGISAPVHDLSCRQRRARSPLSPPPRKLFRGDFVIEDITYEVREDRLFGDGREVVFPETPSSIRPGTKKHKEAIGGRGRSRHGGGGVETLKKKGKRRQGRVDPDAWALDPRFDHFRTGFRGGHDSYPVPWDGRGRIPKGGNTNTVLRNMERSGQVRKKKRKSKDQGEWRSKAAREESLRCTTAGRGRGRAYVAGGGSAGDKKATVEDCESDGEAEVKDGQDRSKVQFNDHDAANTSGPEERRAEGVFEGAEWTDVDDHVDIDAGRVRRRRRSIGGSGVDIYETAHYHPDEPRPFNVKRIRDKALKTLGTHRRDKGKGKARAPPVDPPDPDNIYDVSDSETVLTLKPKKIDPYEVFKKTTGRHPRHFHINRHGEAVERFVLDRRPLEEGEEEPTGRNRRRPMIDVVNVKTGERTRKKIRGYDKIPTLVKVAAGVDMLNGRLPPRRRREVEDGEEDGEAEGEGEEENPKPRRKKTKGRKKKDGCVVM